MKRGILSSLTACAGLLAGMVALAGEPFHTVGSDSHVSFEATGPAGLKINGESAGVKTVDEGGKITFSASVAELHTGIGLRDKHLHKYLETEKHGTATVTVDRSKVSLPASGKTSGSVTGDVTIHGVTRPTRVSYVIEKRATDFHVTGDFEVNIQDFKIEKPCYLGVCVADLVKVHADFAVQGG